MEINPRVLFERMFGSGDTAEERRARMREDKSILDFVTEDLADLGGRIGPGDRARLNEYTEHIREVERRIQRAEQQVTRSSKVPTAPVGVPDSFEDHVDLLFDLLALSYEADLTRVFTFMMARELSQRTYPNIGVIWPHHAISHHANNPERVAAHATVNTHHVALFAKFLERLRSTPDGDGSLLDHSMILYGSGMGNGNVHAADPLPLVIVGGAAGDQGRPPRRGEAAHAERESAAERRRQVRRRDRHLRRQHGASRTVSAPRAGRFRAYRPEPFLR